MLRWISILGGLLIMMGHHARSQALSCYFRLEDQVPENHLLRSSTLGDISEGQFVMHFNRDRSGRVTSFDVATDMVRPMTFFKAANHAQE
jgi:hypothetical protein